MLRGVNPGKRRMKMEAPRAMWESLGLEDPQAYVQSGNVVFRTRERNPEKLAKRIEEAIEKTFGFQSDTVLRTAEEMRGAIARNGLRGVRRSYRANWRWFLAGDANADVRQKIAAVKDIPEEAGAERSRALHLLSERNGAAQTEFRAHRSGVEGRVDGAELEYRDGAIGGWRNEGLSRRDKPPNGTKGLHPFFCPVGTKRATLPPAAADSPSVLTGRCR
jgi:uncharacterized protein (DUF1697 family)